MSIHVCFMIFRLYQLQQLSQLLDSIDLEVIFIFTLILFYFKLFYCKLYIVHCTLYIVHCTLYIVHCTWFTIQFGKKGGKKSNPPKWFCFHENPIFRFGIPYSDIEFHILIQNPILESHILIMCLSFSFLLLHLLLYQILSCGQTVLGTYNIAYSMIQGVPHYVGSFIDVNLDFRKN